MDQQEKTTKLPTEENKKEVKSSLDIKSSLVVETYPTDKEVEKITREIIREESSKIKDSLATNSVIVLGIFASFITFLTIEVQVLKTVCDYSRILGFSMFILGAVLIFIGFIIYFTDSQNKKILQIIIPSIISLFLFIGGIIFIAKGNDEYVCKLNRLDSDFQELKQNLRSENENWLQKKNEQFYLIINSLSKKE